MKQRSKIRFGVSGQSNPLKRPEQKKEHSPARKGFSKPQKSLSTLSEREWQRPQKSNAFQPRKNQSPTAAQSNAQQSSAHSASRTVVGSIKRHPDGYGFLIPDDSNLPDVYVGKNSMAGVMTNDKIEVSIYRDGNRFRGELKKIISRETKSVSGFIEMRGPFNGVIRDQSHAWGDDLKVTIPSHLKVKNGDWVQVQIATYPDHMRGFHGELIAVIGDIHDAKNDNLRVLSSAGIPHIFTKETMQEASRIPDHVTDSDRHSRKDLTHKKFITIDGKTAKDFDDAIYVEKQGRKGFRLWVAIADVSHYVKPETAIDRDAYDRGTSTYFPGFVSPMLPEALSNEICSLKPKVDRLALTCEMEIDFQGNLQTFSFYEAVICSQSRVTYGEAQEIIEERAVEKHQHVAEENRLAAELSRALMQRRFANGSLNLEVPETVIEVDDSGLPVDIIRSERLFAHRLIEELMLVANIAAARFLDQNGVGALYRVHDSPKEDAIFTLEGYLEGFGYRKELSGRDLQKKLTEALQAFAGQPQEIILNILTLRSMMQAKYSPENIGHFGLGFSHYAHFTSPIRRYPDLIIHRLIKSIVIPQKGYRKIAQEDLETAGSILSACEQRSVKAERQIISIKKARFIEKYLGEEFEGLISSVTKFGVFVLLRQFDVDGLVKADELGERMEFDEDRLRLFDRRSGRAYEIGDRLKVQIAAVDIQSGRIDFVPATGEERGHGRQHLQEKKNSSSQKRGTPQNNRERVREARVSRSGRKDQAESARGTHGKNVRKGPRKNRRKDRKRR